jgi:hypothetical protein
MKIKIINLILHNKVNSFIKHKHIYYGTLNEENTEIY